MNGVTFLAHSEADTDKLGAALDAVLPSRVYLALIGTLGSGKTRLVQAIAAAAGINRREVVSPTFVLMQSYQGRRLIYHFDAYRLSGDDEFLELGVEEYAASDALVIVEWADRVVGCLPDEKIEIQVTVLGETERRFEISAHGQRFAEPLERLAAMLQ